MRLWNSCIGTREKLRERYFSALRRLKTYLRSTIKEDRLSGLAQMHIYKHDVSLNSEDIVDDLAAERLEAEGWSSFFRLANSSALLNGKRKGCCFNSCWS